MYGRRGAQATPSAPAAAKAGPVRVPIGPLTHEDLRMLRDYCGYSFDWPPKDGQSVPKAALFVGYARLQQIEDGGLRDLFGDLQQVRISYQRLTGENPVDDAFLVRVARSSTSPLARAFLDAGGTSPRYA
ncbi:hypothetical protein BJY21_000246 [Kineosphaera limosa]|uniref:hypothetical protein n=1 Tax=Kineosphaera limosa TaxID=111564 RepID=UPI0012F9EE29|nr:hypothetical protein [Kineosphaera limosa]NYD99061.1 hypothetical protein [Kineosphaera limosa]